MGYSMPTAVLNVVNSEDQPPNLIQSEIPACLQAGKI
jgi:hypothetical protein